MRGLRVFIACDRAVRAGRLAAQLGVLGHHVTGTAVDGPPPVDAARRLRPDLVILSLPLPPVDGTIDAARAILTEEGGCPVVLDAYYVTADVVRRAQQSGIGVFLSPTADVQALRAVIDLAQRRFRELRILFGETGDWPEALHARTVVEAAKRVVMTRFGFPEVEAFSYLRRYSQSLPLPLAALAVRILEAEDLLFGPRGLAPCLRVMLRILAQRDAPARPLHSPALRSPALR